MTTTTEQAQDCREAMTRLQMAYDTLHAVKTDIDHPRHQWEIARAATGVASIIDDLASIVHQS